MPTALITRKTDGKPGQVYYPLALTTTPSPPSPLPSSHLQIAISAFALNHRDLFIRQHLYPGTTPGVPLCADGVGTVTSTGPSDDAKAYKGKRVILLPCHGWDTDPLGPEDPKGIQILGGTSLLHLGTACTSVSVSAENVALAPAHLSDVEAAALPLVGLTAYRATLVKAAEAMGQGKRVLVTGIGGGVALMALQFAVARGADVWVTSGSEDKIARAVGMGASGGVSYKVEGWEKALLEKVNGGNARGAKVFDAIIDGTGKDIVQKSVKLLRHGGVLSVYGMTVSPKMDFLMAAVLKNIEVRGSTMGSAQNFRDMIKFVEQHKIKPVVSRVVKGLSNLEEIDGLFEDMKAAKQFGKLVVEVTDADREADKSGESKL